ncbi:MAG: GNAT family N-acetyltransferase [Coriobacteriia bacterium]|nr:GNAT family N-acetyltransferase [Coriobacteriia bacterium]
MPIKTQRLYITEFDKSMAESVHLNSLDEDNRRFIPDEVFETVDAARQALDALISFYSMSNSPLVYPVFLNEGQQIGHVQVFPENNNWELGYQVAKQFTNNGYATEAVSAFLPLVMNKLGITEILAVCRADNEASRRVLEKCGFALKAMEHALHHGEQHLICRYRRLAQ